MQIGVSRPAAGRVRLARLDAVADEAATDTDRWLTADEAARLQAMSAPARRRSFLAGHWLARRVAGEFIRIDEARIGLDRHADGRPLLLVDAEPVPLSLSLSHSGDWLACAISAVPVGVDVELPRRVRDWQALARFAFSPDEADRLQRASDAQRSGVFHVLWTLKEAHGKRSGEGLLPERSRRVTTLASDPSRAEACSWPLGEGALAIASEPGLRIELVDGDALGEPAYWRYRDDG